MPELERSRDLVWVGNWGDEERSRELAEFLLEPVRVLSLSSQVYGVRYSEEAKSALAAAGAEYRGWLPNFRVPEVFAAARVTVHVPRRPYAGALPGIPTIRPFEALASGIPLISAPWQDSEGLFEPGRDYLVARDGTEMKRQLRAVLEDQALASALAEHGRRTVLDRHTCAHRVEQLLQIGAGLGLASPAASSRFESRVAASARES
jgi:spore maturation protein CgeB